MFEFFVSALLVVVSSGWCGECFSGAMVLHFRPRTSLVAENFVADPLFKNSRHASCLFALLPHVKHVVIGGGEYD